MQTLSPTTAVTSLDLYAANLPEAFWKPVGFPRAEDETEWAAAASIAEQVLPPAARAGGDLRAILWRVLGEGQFGRRHWELGYANRTYYLLKPALPRRLIKLLRRLQRPLRERSFGLGWPIEDRYVLFQRELVREMLRRSGQTTMKFVNFWPGGADYAFALTHDVETAAGQKNVATVADLEESCGFRSRFNFIPRRYPLDHGLMSDLVRRGFEIGVHDLHHDGKLFGNREAFNRRAVQINAHMREFGAVGFATGLTIREPEWMQQLDIEYDTSFFDTDPFEPIPGGTMCIWPFRLGQFTELPYTLVQDHTLLEVLRERTPALWLRKVEFLARHWGLALLNSHPDYLVSGTPRRVYTTFLDAMAHRSNGWHALPRDVARWWRARRVAPASCPPPAAEYGTLTTDLWA